MSRLFSKDSWLVVGLLLTLVFITIAAGLRQSDNRRLPALSATSNEPNGGRALFLWLDQLGYQPQAERSSEFSLPSNTSLALILEPITTIENNEWEIIDQWVEGGGVLVLAGQGWWATRAFGHYEFEIRSLTIQSGDLALQNPLFTSPSILDWLPNRSAVHMESQRQDFVTHLAVQGYPILVSFQQGAGRVILSTSTSPFTNAGLKESGNPELVLNLVATASRRGRAWFDEWHLGIRSEAFEVSGPTQWLRYTPAGRSLLYLAGIVFLALLLQGRAFGRPIPLNGESTRRAPLEYITALANLSRRAGHRSAVLQQYRHQIKRQLGRRYRINPTLSDEEFTHTLAQVSPEIDAPALLKLLLRLHQKQVSEHAMLQLAREASDWLSKD